MEKEEKIELLGEMIQKLSVIVKELREAGEIKSSQIDVLINTIKLQDEMIKGLEERVSSIEKDLSEVWDSLDKVIAIVE